jgi:hypothetical protein
MLKRCTIGIWLLVWLSWGTLPAVAGSNQERHVTWDGLSEIIGKNVRVVMPDGSRIEGRATELQADALVVNIRKTANKAAYPKGKFLVARATLRALDVSRNTVYWRATGVVVGTVAGAGLFAALFERHRLATSGLAGTTYFALGVSIPVVGYFVGNAADHHTITYVITP